MTAAEYLARVGLDYLIETRLGGPTLVYDDDDDRTHAEAADLGRPIDHARVRELLLGTDPKPRAGDLAGAKWLGIITWPDRVPGLKTWSGQATLAKLIAAHQARMRPGKDRPDGWDAADLFAVRGLYRTGKGEGSSGIDATTCRDAIDIGFSPSQLGMDVVCRPAVELLAIVGLESVPLVSYGPRDCGFVHGGRVWRFAVESRDGGWIHRWGELREYARQPAPT